MDRNFYYRKTADAVLGSAGFASKISAAPTTYGLTAAQATAFGVVNTALQSAAAAASDTATRTSLTIEARDIALSNMRASATLLAKIVYATPTVTDVELMALGLLPRSSRTPIPPPMEAPRVELISVVNRVAKFRVHSASAVTKRGKPRGCVGANICTFVGPVAPANAEGYQFQGMTSRSIGIVQFPDSVPSGATIRMSACWVTARGAKSFYSDPIVFSLQGGEILPGESMAA